MNKRNKYIAILCMLSMLFEMIGIQQVKADAGSYLLSLGRPAYASTANGGDVPTRATDEDINTAWGAVWNVDNQWIDVDLGAAAQIDRVVLSWQSPNTYATQYQIQVSNDEVNWQTIYTQNNGTGGVRVPDVNGNNYCVEDLTVSGTGRYVRMYAAKCVTGYGVALRDFKIYGTGGITLPPKNTVNLALNKQVTVSSFLQPWWSKDANGNVTVPLTGAQAVDGNQSTYWLSDTTGDPNTQWMYVDLGQVYTIGEVDITWDAEFGRVYDIQISNDAQSWTTVYRQLHGTGEPENIPLYATTRYVRMQGIAMGRGSGYSVHEFKVLQYVTGDPHTTYTIGALPTPQTVTVGQGSYLTNDTTLAQPRDPKYITSNIKGPIPSNDWWTSVIYKRLSDGMAALPLMYQYYDTGLGFYYASKLFTAPNDGGMDTKCNNMDLYISTGSIVNTPVAKLDAYGDYSATIVFSDNDTPKMRNTLIKGSPYIYSTFSDPASVEVSGTTIVGLFDDNNKAVLAKDGDTVTADHIGIEVINTDTAPVTDTLIHDYGIFAPEGTVFTRVGSKIKISLGGGQNYMVVGVLPGRSDLHYAYQHAYAFVTNTSVSYRYEEASANVVTTYTNTVDLKRTGFSSNSLMTLFPTQWKYTTAGLTNLSYTSARGTMKVLEGNAFTTTNKFYGITPSFGEPTESGSYSRTQMMNYLNTFKVSVTKDYWVADPYWEGKKMHPLSMAILISQQLGEYEMRDEFISILRKILVNWLTYDGSEDYPYYMYYSSDWGTLIGQGGDHGMGINLSDHHFLWGYFTFAAGVVASYDKDFVNNYGGMVEQLLRDAQNPYRNDTMYPWMRNFDPYEGHSWAGGYGDNQSSNNQESSSEATFAWAGEYLWGLATGNNTYRDAGIWGFTLEVNAIEQYWFDYDQDNWASDYDPGVTGMVWGNAYTYGTYFSGNPSCIYGIHWLPVSPVLTYLGYKPAVAARINSDYRKDENDYQAKLAAQGTPNADPEGWFHITWPFEALSDPQAVINKWDDSKLPDDERFNSYWFVQNMAAKGNRATDVWSSNWTGYQVFKKGTQYSAVIWNPTDSTKFVQFCNSNGNIGSAYVPAKATLTVNPFINNGVPSVTIPAAAADPAPIAIPGLVEAENYYTNFSCMTESCSEGGLSLAYIDSGDSALYDVKVQTEGDYTFSVRAINNSSAAGQIQLKSNLSGSGVLSTVDIPVTGSWSTFTGTVHLKAGTQRLRLLFSKGGFNLNWFSILSGNATKVQNPVITPATGTYTTAQTVTITEPTEGAAIYYTTDGTVPSKTNGTLYTGTFTVSATKTVKAIAYKTGMTDSDVTTSVITIAAVSQSLKIEAENYTAMSGVAAEPCADTGGGQNIGYIDTDDWMDYAVNIPTTGTYTVDYRVMGWNTAAQIQLKQGSTILAATGVNTNNTWNTVTSATFTLQAGVQTIRVYAGGGGFNLNWLEFKPVSQVQKAATPVINPATGTYASAQSVTITDGTSGVTMRYTTDGTTPSETVGTVYSGAFTISSTATVKAIAYKSGMTASDIATSVITISSVPVSLKVEAENYNSMSGVATEPCGDTGGGQNVGYIDTGDWMDYSITIATAGTYTVDYRVNGWSTGAQIQLMKDGNVLATTGTNTGSVWSTITSGTFSLTAGTYTIRIYSSGGGFNLNWMEFKLQASAGKVAAPVITPASGSYGSAQTVAITDATQGATIYYTTDGSTPSKTNGTLYAGTFTVSATTTVKAIASKSGMTDSDVTSSVITITSGTVSVLVEAENYTAMSGVASEPCADVGGGQNVGYLDTGDWMDYSVTIPSAGTYKVDFRVNGWDGGAQIQLMKDGIVLTSTATNTGNVWATVTSGAFSLTAGTYTLRTYISGGGFNLNWMKFIKQ